jgi:GTPase
VMARAMERRPPPQVHSRRFKILYVAQQIADSPSAHLVPALIIFCNDPRLLTDAYQRYLEEQLREEFDLRGCPVKWILRSRQRD